MRSWRTDSRILLACLSAIVVVATGAASASAQTCPTVNRSKAVQLAKDAGVHMKAQEYALAMDDLRAAFALCPEPRLHHSMGSVLEAQGNLQDALASFRACIQDGDSEIRVECMKRADAVQERLRIGALLVVAKPAGALVHLDQSEAGRASGTRLEVATGRHDVEVRYPGYLSHRVSVDVPGAGEVRINVELKPEPPTPVAAKKEKELPTDWYQANSAPEAKQPNTAWNIAGVVLGGATALTGGGLLGYWGYLKTQAKENESVTPDSLIAGSVCLGVGVAAIITSVALWPKAPATASAAPLPGCGMVAIGGRF